MAGSALLEVVEELLGGESPVAAEVAIILDLPDVGCPRGGTGLAAALSHLLIRNVLEADD